jgi:hypothetical protein
MAEMVNFNLPAGPFSNIAFVNPIMIYGLVDIVYRFRSLQFRPENTSVEEPSVRHKALWRENLRLWHGCKIEHVLARALKPMLPMASPVASSDGAALHDFKPALGEVGGPPHHDGPELGRVVAGLVAFWSGPPSSAAKAAGPRKRDRREQGVGLCLPEKGKVTATERSHDRG